MQHKLDELIEYFRGQGPVVLLESQSLNHPAAEVTYLAAQPEAIIKSWGNRIEVMENSHVSTFEANPWDALSHYYEKWNDWLFGYFGYDLKNHIEVLESKNSDAVGAPDLFFMRPGILLQIIKRTGNICWIKGNETKRKMSPILQPEATINRLKSTVSEEDYLAAIAAAKEEIYEGDFYEVNLSHQLQAQFSGNPYHWYQQMRAAGPVPFGAYIQFDEMAICSSSPERFLAKQATSVFSQPIKGTMKRHLDPAKDQKLIKKLHTSAKNKAENLMIVDLVRNDLSRIASPGSVRVPKLFEIQSFDTVHQMVSTVCAETQIADPVEIIRACYPMGSMTGAPKISAMKAIERLEIYKRGIYSGAIGYLSPNDDFDLNVIIRTAIIKNNMLYYGVGGAITSDSNPVDEWNETWLKAQALQMALKKQTVEQA